MDTKEKYWLEMAEYDIKTAEAMLESKRYLYVGFMAHQTIEKILKAYFVMLKMKPLLFRIASLFLPNNQVFMKSYPKNRWISLTCLNQ